MSKRRNILLSNLPSTGHMFDCPESTKVRSLLSLLALALFTGRARREGGRNGTINDIVRSSGHTDKTYLYIFYIGTTGSSDSDR